ncbi:hypothetical protein [Streptomyces sp. RFCAC02]|uniref:LppU/SCO3897 family protein n=1 Tax=Streptomyces sp. RFCAC02 TaxID=2499143 RepID=UPI0019D313BA|nr:hypothetical protein [Streptomyces sp. RFCAC02]
MLATAVVLNRGDDGTDPPEPSSGSEAVQAEEGDCFANEGSLRDPELTPMGECESGAFEVLRVVHGSAAEAACEGTPLSDLTAVQPEQDVTLCLTYRHGEEDVYHAREGDCVEEYDFGDDRWMLEDCSTGDFTVVERLEGTSDDSGCDRSRPGSYSRPYPVESWPELDTVLCLSANHPSDIGYAQPSDCLRVSGPEGHRSFEFADCDGADIATVTQRKNSYDADDIDAYCGRDGGSGFSPEGFPELAYTACWRFL